MQIVTYLLDVDTLLCVDGQIRETKDVQNSDKSSFLMLYFVQSLKLVQIDLSV